MLPDRICRRKKGGVLHPYRRSGKQIIRHLCSRVDFIHRNDSSEVNWVFSSSQTENSSAEQPKSSSDAGAAAASVGGAAAGATAAVAGVMGAKAAGTAGAAALTSGLAAVGGSMLAGLLVVAAAPVVGGLIGYGIYKACKQEPKKEE